MVSSYLALCVMRPSLQSALLTDMQLALVCISCMHGVQSAAHGPTAHSSTAYLYLPDFYTVWFK